MRCDNCQHFVIGTDNGNTSRDGKMFGVCMRAGKSGSMTQPVRWDRLSGLVGPPGALGVRIDGQPHTKEEIEAHEKLVRDGDWQYGTAYHNRASLYVLPNFGCVEYVAR